VSRSYECIVVEPHDELVFIKLIREDGSRNYLNKIFLSEIADALVTVPKEYNPKVIILTGGGKVFSLGADLAEVKTLAANDAVLYSKIGQGIIKRIRELEAVVVAAVNGMALGGGFEIVLACDIIWAHTRAVFAFPECLRGLLSAWGGTRLAVQRIPSSLAAEMLMTGMYLGSENANRHGIVSKIYEGKEFHNQVLKEALRLTVVNRDILLHVKKLLNATLSFEEGLDRESIAFAEIVSKNIASI